MYLLSILMCPTIIEFNSNNCRFKVNGYHWKAKTDFYQTQIISKHVCIALTSQNYYHESYCPYSAIIGIDAIGSLCLAISLFLAEVDDEEGGQDFP